MKSSVICNGQGVRTATSSHIDDPITANEIVLANRNPESQESEDPDGTHTTPQSYGLFRDFQLSEGGLWEGRSQNLAFMLTDVKCVLSYKI